MGLVLRAWGELESCRYPGPTFPGPIPWDAIRDWTREEGLDGDWRRLLTEVIHGMDVKRSNRISSELANRGQRNE